MRCRRCWAGGRDRRRPKPAVYHRFAANPEIYGQATGKRRRGRPRAADDVAEDLQKLDSRRRDLGGAAVPSPSPAPPRFSGRDMVQLEAREATADKDEEEEEDAVVVLPRAAAAAPVRRRGIILDDSQEDPLPPPAADAMAEQQGRDEGLPL